LLLSCACDVNPANNKATANNLFKCFILIYLITMRYN
jgi:hypothetical protein